MFAVGTNVVLLDARVTVSVFALDSESETVNAIAPGVASSLIVLLAMADMLGAVFAACAAPTAPDTSIAAVAARSHAFQRFK